MKPNDAMDDRLTLSDKEYGSILHYKQWHSDVEAEEHNLDKLGKDNGGKLALFILRETAILEDLLNSEYGCYV